MWVVDCLHVLPNIPDYARGIGVQAGVELVELLFDIGGEVVEFGKFRFAFLEMNQCHWVVDFILNFVNVYFCFVVFWNKF